jgi:predicted NUDIX family NTP pyrophosphohydrolase
MPGSSVLPVAFHKNQLYFLFGKENPYADTPGWSDFGGGIETGETPLKTAMREAAEELTGFLGDTPTVKQHIKTHGGLYTINNADKYHIHIFKTEYDPNMPKYYNRNHAFLWKCMDEKAKMSVIFEKIEIAWMTIADMKRNRNKFRPFYKEYLDRIIAESKEIRNFISKNHRKTKKTRPRLSKSLNRNKTSSTPFIISNADPKGRLL